MEADITTHHDTLPTIRSWLGRKFVYGRGGAVLAPRHENKAAPAVLTPTYAAAAPARSSVLRGAFPFAPPLSHSAPERSRRRSRRSFLGPWPRLGGPSRSRPRCPSLVAGRGDRRDNSRSARRMLVTALAVDTTVAFSTRQRQARAVAPLQMITGRRLDDLAYGMGLWFGSVEQRTARALIPNQPRFVSRFGACCKMARRASQGPSCSRSGG